MPATRCPKGSPGGALLFVACMDAGQGREQDTVASLVFYIQRLMVTGNFALLAGLAIDEVTDWYLAVYLDAYEWVELPNTFAMALFADGGILASKPYAASGAYINRMSNYCKNCYYQVKAVTSAKACPFNALFWDFLARNESQFGQDARMQLAYKNWHNIAARARLSQWLAQHRQAFELEKRQVFQRHASRNRPKAQRARKTSTQLGLFD